MPTTTIDVKDLPARLSEIIAEVSAGAEIIVMDGNVPRARLVPPGAGRQRIPGLHPGAMIMADDFDEPLPDDFWTGAP